MKRMKKELANARSDNPSIEFDLLQDHQHDNSGAASPQDKQKLAGRYAGELSPGHTQLSEMSHGIERQEIDVLR